MNIVGFEPQLSPNVKSLGFKLDSNLTLKKHIGKQTKTA